MPVEAAPCGKDWSIGDDGSQANPQRERGNFIYITTQTLTREQLAALSEEVGEQRTLLVMCSAFRCKVDTFPNLTVKKIPNAMLNRCEWGKDDYSLQIANLPSAPELMLAEPSQKPAASRKAKPVPKEQQELL